MIEIRYSLQIFLFLLIIGITINIDQIGENEYLKKLSSNIDIDNNYFDIITEYLIEKSIFIYKMRYKFIEKLNNNVNKIFKRLTNIENFNIKYVTNYEVMDDNLFKEKMKELYKKSLKKEIRNGSTLIGPHRDDLEFYIDDKNLKLYGSQGQQRMAVLALKLSEIELFKNVKGECPECKAKIEEMIATS